MNQSRKQAKEERILDAIEKHIEKLEDEFNVQIMYNIENVEFL